jgi:hypothetical protein
MKFKQGDLIEGGAQLWLGRIISVEDGYYRIFWVSNKAGEMMSDTAQFKLFGSDWIDHFYEKMKGYEG